MTGAKSYIVLPCGHCDSISPHYKQPGGLVCDKCGGWTLWSIYEP